MVEIFFCDIYLFFFSFFLSWTRYHDREVPPTDAEDVADADGYERFVLTRKIRGELMPPEDVVVDTETAIRAYWLAGQKVEGRLSIAEFMNFAPPVDRQKGSEKARIVLTGLIAGQMEDVDIADYRHQLPLSINDDTVIITRTDYDEFLQLREEKKNFQRAVLGEFRNLFTLSLTVRLFVCSLLLLPI